MSISSGSINDTLSSKPLSRPQNPCFSSGPCAKPPFWQPMILKEAALGRSHRSRVGIQKIHQSLISMREVLEIPTSHWIALVSGSATGAMESLLWNLLGPRSISVLAWDVFGRRWAKDITDELKLANTHIYEHETELDQTDFSHDVVFTWNASTSGICAPQDPWIDPARQGLTICDATSAAFALPLPWEELDATAFSWQKGLGGESGHGVIVLGPRARERLESYAPSWPVPYLYRLAVDRKINSGFFEGQTLNTPSLLVVEDALYALKWAKEQGAVKEMHRRTLRNFSKIRDWVEETPWIDFLAPIPRFRSPVTVCLTFTENPAWPWVQDFCRLLEEEGAGFDLKNHERAPPSLRIWAGPTIETSDLEALFPWLTWSYHQMKQNA